MRYSVGTTNVSMGMFAGIFGDWEIVLMVAIVLVLFFARNLPEIAKGLGIGIKEFRDAAKDVAEEVDKALDPGEKQSGVVSEAFTTANTTARFIYPRPYDPLEFLNILP